MRYGSGRGSSVGSDTEPAWRDEPEVRLPIDTDIAQLGTRVARPAARTTASKPGRRRRAELIILGVVAVMVAATVAARRSHPANSAVAKPNPPISNAASSPARPSPPPVELPGRPYPEAAELSGVRVVDPRVPEDSRGSLTFDLPSFAATLTTGRGYPVIAHLSYLIEAPPGSRPVVLSLSATNGTAQCPRPFVIRASYAYDVTCIVTARPGAGSFIMTVTALDGSSVQSGSVAFEAR